jgi:predicted ATP-dependent serine protease
MVKKIDELFVCEECGMKFKKMEWAEKCETWCREFKSCNPEYAKHSVDFS